VRTGGAGEEAGRYGRERLYVRSDVRVEPAEDCDAVRNNCHKRRHRLETALRYGCPEQGDAAMDTTTPSFARAFVGFLTSVSLTMTLMLVLAATP